MRIIFVHILVHFFDPALDIQTWMCVIVFNLVENVSFQKPQDFCTQLLVPPSSGEFSFCLVFDKGTLQWTKLFDMHNMTII